MQLEFREIEPIRSVHPLLDLARLVAQVKGPKKVAVAAATEAHAIEAVNEARIEGLIEPILSGNPERMRKIAQELGIRVENPDLRPARDPEEVAEPASQAAFSGEADILIKGSYILGVPPRRLKPRVGAQDRAAPFPRAGLRGAGVRPALFDVRRGDEY